MKNNTKRTTLAALFACAFAAASFGAVSLNVASATDETPVTMPTLPDKFTMSETASLRLETEENPDIDFGLRFKTSVDQEWFNGLTNPQVYTLLVPTDMLTGELKKDTENTITVDVNEDKKFAVGDETYVFGTVLTDIPDDAWGREISARSYIVIGEEIYYTPVVEGTFASASRSVAYVANAALESDAEQWSATAQYLKTSVEVPTVRNIEVGSSSGILKFGSVVSTDVQAFLNENLTVTKTAGDDCFTVENGVLTANTEGAATFTVESEALGINETVTVSAYKRAYGTLVDFEHLDATDYVDVYEFHNTSIATYEGQNAVKVSTTGVGNQLGIVTTNVKTPEWYANFDTVTVKAAWVADDPSSVTDQTVNFYNKGALRGANGVTIEKTVVAADYSQNIVRNGVVRFVFKMEDNTGLVCPASMYFMGFTLGINDISNVGGTVNLYEKFHTDAEHATFKFGEEVIQNPEEYAGTVDGVITATISADGYADGTITANYNYIKKQAYGAVADFTNLDASAITACSPGNQADLSTNSVGAYDQDGVKGYYFTIDHTADASDAGKAEFYGIKFALPENASNFDTYSVTVKLVAATKNPSGGNVAWCLYGKTTTGTYRLTNKYVGTEFTHTGTIGDAYSKNGELVVYSKIQAATEVATATYVVTDIKLGYADVTVGSEFSWENYGLSASELTDVTFNGAAVDAATFAATEAGTLSFTVNKEGYLPATLTINFVALAAA